MKIDGYPGGAVLPIYDALYRAEAPFQHILCRHEQGLIHAAEGYARVTGKPGVVIATSGPGATNLITGITDAMMDSLPVVIFTGQVSTAVIGSDAFQEADVIGLTTPITKHNYQVTDTSRRSSRTRCRSEGLLKHLPQANMLQKRMDSAASRAIMNRHLEWPGCMVPTVRTWPSTKRTF